jgi:hypothetical protein
MTRSSRLAPNQSSTLGSSEPLATTSIAQPNSVAAVPTPTNCVLPAARSRKNALARTMSAMPTVKTNNARPRRVRFECRTPAHATSVNASSTYSSGSSQDSDVAPEPKLRRRYSSGAISGCCGAVKKATSVSAAITVATAY